LCGGTGFSEYDLRQLLEQEALLHSLAAYLACSVFAYRMRIAELGEGFSFDRLS
jgi:hypothetical protein